MFEECNIKKDETGWGCWPYVRRVNAYKVLVGKPQRGYYFRNLEVEGRIII
jgi:hypothetical protein